LDSEAVGLYGRGYGGGGISFGPAYTPPIVKQLLITLVAVFAAQLLVRDQLSFDVIFAVVPGLTWGSLWLWQPFTYMWLHLGPSGRGLLHLAVNAFMLWMFGSPLAMAWGAKRFLRYYLACGVGAGFVIATWPYLAVLIGLSSPAALNIPTIGASGAIYGLLLGYSLSWPDRTLVFFPLPVAIRAIWLIPITFLLSVYADQGGVVSHVGHLGGVLVGWILLRQGGTAAGLPTWTQLKWRWQRLRMRRKLRAVRWDEDASRQRRNDDRTLH
jgi:membrane associated rhomboid family serine protease